MARPGQDQVIGAAETECEVSFLDIYHLTSPKSMYFISVGIIWIGDAMHEVWFAEEFWAKRLTF